jgi:outer membrane protein assembly factor BamB
VPLLLAVAVLVACALAMPSQAVAGQAVGYQQNAGHTGTATEPGLDPPYRVRWAVDVGSRAGYAVLAGGRAFAAVRNPATGPYGTRVVALNAADGSRAWERSFSHTYYWAGIAYGRDTLVVVTYGGEVTALDPATGAVRWTKAVGDGSSSEPTVDGDTVYVTGAGKLFALDLGTGNERWAREVAGSSHSSPAVAGGRVHVGFSCATYGFGTGLGEPLWRSDEACSGGGGKTTVAANGRVYARATGKVHDAANGSTVGTFGSNAPPAVAGDTAYLVAGTSLRAVDATTLATRWTADGDFASTPLVLNDHVIAGGSRGLVALDRATGAERWRDSATAVRAPDEHNYSEPVAGVAAGEGLLVVPSENKLVAYEHGTPPPAPPPAGEGTAAAPADGPSTPAGPAGPLLTLRAGRTSLALGERTRLRATLAQTSRRAGRTVRLEIDEWPFDRFVPAGRGSRGRTDRTGTARFFAVPRRNVRVRARLVSEPSVTSAPVTLYADFPGRTTLIGARSRRPRVRLTVYAFRGAKLRAAPVYLYLSRRAGEPLRLVARRRWQRATRRYVATTLPFPRGALRSRSARFAVCVREPDPGAFGRPSPIDALCGRPEIPRE